MSLFLFSCCSQNNDGDIWTQDIETETKVSGKERILRLNQQENFHEYTKYFKNEEKNIYENNPSNDIFNINKENQIFKIKNSNTCLFCGGENCKVEDPNLYDKCAIKGLNSDLFYDCIFASQRPSTALIKKYDLIKSFKENNIKLIANCEVHGEHPNCGPNRGLENDSGYAYSPSLFISEDIDVLNCGFEENTPPFTLDFMLDVVKKISFVIKYKNGKVLVHSHSGNGRTCLVIACFFIFYFNKTADESINELRNVREKAISSDSQVEFIHKFEIYMKILKNVFTDKQITIDNHIKNQIILDYNFNKNQNSALDIPYIVSSIFNKNQFGNQMLDSKDALSKLINIQYIPKILIKCLDKIIQIRDQQGLQNGALYQTLNGKNSVIEEDNIQLNVIKKNINENNWELLDQNDNLLIITELFFSWLNENVIECINPKKIERLWYKCSKLFNENSIINSNNSINKPDSKRESVDTSAFDEFMRGSNPIPKNKIYKFISIFQLIFSKTECEIIKFISLFLLSIYPRVNTENTSADLIREYKRFVYKLCFFLLGFNLDKVNAISDSKNLKEYTDVKRFILILEFFIFYSSKDEKKADNQNNNLNNDWLSNFMMLKNEYEEREISSKNDIILFLEKRPKNDFISVKYFFFAES